MKPLCANCSYVLFHNQLSDLSNFRNNGLCYVMLCQLFLVMLQSVLMGHCHPHHQEKLKSIGTVCVYGLHQSTVKIRNTNRREKHDIVNDSNSDTSFKSGLY